MSNGFDTVTRRWVVGALLAGVTLPAWGEAPSRSPRPVARPGSPGALAQRGAAGSGGAALVEAAKLGGMVGYQVVDLQSGEVLEARDPEAGLPPASTTKAITSLYALERLGAPFRFTTRLIATGPVSGGRIKGDLVLTGSGDPTLSTDGLAELAAALRARGVTGVSGRFLVEIGRAHV